ncbi:MAG TPA: hypothetical protein VGE74_28870 [Gemmata sp.]
MLALMFVSGIFVLSRDLVEAPSNFSGLRVTMPIFVCEACDGAVITALTIRAALSVTPEYAALLHRHPDAVVCREA